MYARAVQSKELRNTCEVARGAEEGVVGQGRGGGGGMYVV
jgi:hypothetical protein